MELTGDGYPVGVNVVENITKKSLFIDDGGCIWAKYVVWVKGSEKIRWHKLGDIETAIWQHFHILEGYLGQYVGLGKRRVKIDGELKTVKVLAISLVEIAKDYLPVEPTEDVRSDDAQATIANTAKVLGRVTSRYKQMSLFRIEKVNKNPQGEAEKARTAGELLPAAGDLSNRAHEILKKSEGIRQRLSRLHQKHRISVKILVNLYKVLGETYAEISKQPISEWTESQKRRLGENFNPNRASAIAGLVVVNIQPYSKRVMSREIKRLAKIPGYLERKDYEAIQRTIVAALKKMERAIAQIDNRFSPKVSRLPRR